MACSFQSCKKDPIAKTISYDYLIFGTIYGECGGPDCVTLYKLENGKLYKNNNRTYPKLTQQYAGVYTELSQDKFNYVKDLPDYFPEDFLKQSEQFIGCPDCVDQGGYFVEFGKGDYRKNWMVDMSTANIPKTLHTFIDKLREKMELLK